jgi:hypothetical protein
VTESEDDEDVEKQEHQFTRRKKTLRGSLQECILGWLYKLMRSSIGEKALK